MEWVKEFNKFDLYTKSTKVPDIEALKPYYQVIAPSLGKLPFAYSRLWWTSISLASSPSEGSLLFAVLCDAIKLVITNDTRY